MMELFMKIAIDYVGKKLHLMYLIGGASQFTAPGPQPPYFLPRIKTSGLKIRPELRKIHDFIS